VYSISASIANFDPTLPDSTHHMDVPERDFMQVQPQFGVISGSQIDDDDDDDGGDDDDDGDESTVAR